MLTKEEQQELEELQKIKALLEEYGIALQELEGDLVQASEQIVADMNAADALIEQTMDEGMMKISQAVDKDALEEKQKNLNAA